MRTKLPKYLNIQRRVLAELRFFRVLTYLLSIQFAKSIDSYMRLTEWFGLIDKKGAPRICGNCANNTFTEQITDYIEHTPCESKIVCRKCGSIEGLWAYGTYMPF